MKANKTDTMKTIRKRIIEMLTQLGDALRFFWIVESPSPLIEQPL